MSVFTYLIEKDHNGKFRASLMESCGYQAFHINTDDSKKLVNSGAIKDIRNAQEVFDYAKSIWDVGVHDGDALLSNARFAAKYPLLCRDLRDRAKTTVNWIWEESHELDYLQLREAMHYNTICARESFKTSMAPLSNIDEEEKFAIRELRARKAKRMFNQSEPTLVYRSVLWVERMARAAVRLTNTPHEAREALRLHFDKKARPALLENLYYIIPVRMPTLHAYGQLVIDEIFDDKRREMFLSGKACEGQAPKTECAADLYFEGDALGESPDRLLENLLGRTVDISRIERYYDKARIYFKSAQIHEMFINSNSMSDLYKRYGATIKNIPDTQYESLFGPHTVTVVAKLTNPDIVEESRRKVAGEHIYMISDLPKIISQIGTFDRDQLARLSDAERVLEIGKKIEEFVIKAFNVSPLFSRARAVKPRDFEIKAKASHDAVAHIEKLLFRPKESEPSCLSL